MSPYLCALPHPITRAHEGVAKGDVMATEGLTRGHACHGVGCGWLWLCLSHLLCLDRLEWRSEELDLPFSESLLNAQPDETNSHTSTCTNHSHNAWQLSNNMYLSKLPGEVCT